MSRIHVKICGITLPEQAVAISDLDVDALGFILYPKSPRFIDPGRIASIVETLPPFIKTVGVFVDKPVASLVDNMARSRLDIAQLSGSESEAYGRELTEAGINWIRALRIRSSSDLEQISLYQNRYFLLDAWSKDAYGGTGQTFDWKILEQIHDTKKIILAGGINAENVEQAIKDVNPYGLDISSGVEKSAGVKSIELVRSLLGRIRNFEKTIS
jgi:phosphoribosylanthranilate isomerase